MKSITGVKKCYTSVAEVWSGWSV